MMNLGAFVGGAVKGYREQEDANLRQQEFNLRQQDAASSRDFRERALRMQEADEAAKADQRAREKAMRDESAALFQKFYPGDRDEQVGSTEADDGNGGIKTIPTMKTVPGLKPGTDTPEGRAADAGWYAEHLRLTAKHSNMTPEMMEATTKKLEEVRKSDTGRLLDRVTSGDKTALTELLKKTGRDPEGAVYEFKPLDGVNQIKLRDGTVLDLKSYAAANATAEHYKAMREQEQAAQATANSAATRSNLGATTALHQAQATLVPSQIAENQARAAQAGAAAGASTQQANLYRAKAANVGADTAAKGDLKAQETMRKAVKDIVDVDPASVDGKGKKTDMSAFMLRRGSELLSQNPKAGPTAAVTAARAEWVTQEQRVSTFIDLETKGLDKKAIAKRFGTSDTTKIKANLMASKMSVAAAPAVAAVKPNPIVNEDD